VNTPPDPIPGETLSDIALEPAALDSAPATSSSSSAPFDWRPVQRVLRVSACVFVASLLASWVYQAMHGGGHDDWFVLWVSAVAALAWVLVEVRRFSHSVRLLAVSHSQLADEAERFNKTYDYETSKKVN